MLPSARPFHLFALALAGWLNRRQAAAVEYLREENRILRSRLPEGRLRFTDAERKRLAVRGAELGRALLADVATLISPDTILRWHRKLVAAKWTFKAKTTAVRVGLMAKIGALAADFFMAVVRTARGLVTHYTLFVMQHAARAAEIVATTTNPNALFMAQVAKVLTDPVDGLLRAKKFLVMDRDAIFSETVRTALKAEGVRALRGPPSAPNCNAIAERFVGTVRRELTDRINLVGTASLDRALRAFAVRYCAEAPSTPEASADLVRIRPVANGPGLVVRGSFRRSAETLHRTGEGRARGWGSRWTTRGG
jgi:hypothetical protein